MIELCKTAEETGPVHATSNGAPIEGEVELVTVGAAQVLATPGVAAVEPTLGAIAEVLTLGTVALVTRVGAAALVTTVGTAVVVPTVGAAALVAILGVAALASTLRAEALTEAEELPIGGTTGGFHLNGFSWNAAETAAVFGAGTWYCGGIGNG